VIYISFTLWNQQLKEAFCSAFRTGEVMMMHPQVPAPQPTQPIPQHVLDRLESEWRQMRESVPQTAKSLPAAE
jgi:hypothetical protein